MAYCNLAHVLRAATTCRDIKAENVVLEASGLMADALSSLLDG
jgi:hypothetical protein